MFDLNSEPNPKQVIASAIHHDTSHVTQRDGQLDIAGDVMTTTRPVRLTAIVDASYRAERAVTGIGIVLHATDRPGRAGPVIARISELHMGVPAGAIELFAVFRALELARERGYRRVKVRSDYNYMRRKLKQEHAAGRIGDPNTLHGKTLMLARTFDHVVFAYQPRRKNGVAHRLARVATTEEPSVESDSSCPGRSLVE